LPAWEFRGKRAEAKKGEKPRRGATRAGVLTEWRWPISSGPKKLFGNRGLAKTLETIRTGNEKKGGQPGFTQALRVKHLPGNGPVWGQTLCRKPPGGRH